MESWDDLIKTLPTDEQLEKMEKSGELDDIDERIKELQRQTQQMNENIAKKEEMYDMLFGNNDTNSQEKNTKTTKR
ncbi:MAG: hypothetical protein IIZ67_05815 [Bacilli bacterium]|nr:hypothetical protein [Bacilli bacterium]